MIETAPIAENGLCLCSDSVLCILHELTICVLLAINLRTASRRTVHIHHNALIEGIRPNGATFRDTDLEEVFTILERMGPDGRAAGRNQDHAHPCAQEGFHRCHQTTGLLYSLRMIIFTGNRIYRGYLSHVCIWKKKVIKCFSFVLIKASKE